MRIVTWLSEKGGPVALVAAVAIGAGFMACSSDADNNPGTSLSTTAGTGGTGGSGASGSTVTGSTTASSSSKASASSTSGDMGGFGGGSPCDQACKKLADGCGLGDVCADPMVMQFLNCADPNSGCPGQCILDATCQQILETLSGTIDPTLAACIGACQGGQGGGGGAGGGAQGCLQCGQGSCASRGLACFGDGDCQAWLNCIGACNDTACSDACTAAHPGSAALQADLSTCLCTSCSGPCSAIDPCNSGTGNGGAGMGGAGMGGNSNTSGGGN